VTRFPVVFCDDFQAKIFGVKALRDFVVGADDGGVVDTFEHRQILINRLGIKNPLSPIAG
jgi:hypothetical protein